MIYATSMMVNLAEASLADRALLGGKAATLAELSAAGFAVPPGIVVTAGALNEPDLDGELQTAAARLGGDRVAVRSSGAAEDLPDVSGARCSCPATGNWSPMQLPRCTLHRRAASLSSSTCSRGRPDPRRGGDRAARAPRAR